MAVREERVRPPISVHAAGRVTRADLTAGTLALWVRCGDEDDWTVSALVSPGAVAGWIAHAREHATPELVAALGVYVLSAQTCEHAAAWAARQERDRTSVPATSA